MLYIYRIILLVLVFVFSNAVLISQTQPTDTDNDGYYNVSTLDHLRWISENDSSWSWNFELDNDINAADTENWNSGAGWNPIGNNTTNFTGNFDGHGYKIDNLHISRSDEDYVGLFGYIRATHDHSRKTIIKNLGVTNADINGDGVVGAIAGYVDDAAIQLSYSTGSVDASGDIAGGIAGINSYGLIDRSYSLADVSGDRWVAGLIARNSGLILKSFSAGTVSGNEDLGGLTARNFYGETQYSFWDTVASGQSTSASGTGKSTVEMQLQSTFTEEGWNFTFIWDISSGYPFLNLDYSYQPTDTDNDGYLNISTLNQLRWLSESTYDLEKNFELDNDINAADSRSWNDSTGWFAIGMDFYTPYTGIFNGNGYKIDSLFVDNNDRKIVSNRTYYTGLFGFTRGEIRNLNVENADMISSNNHISGILTGRLDSGHVVNCYTSGKLNSSFYKAGGLVGYNVVGHVDSSSSSATVENTYTSTGGLVAENLKGTVSNSYFTGTIDGGDETGGIIGTNKLGIIKDCYSDGLIEGIDETGGISGTNRGSEEFSGVEMFKRGTIVRSYSKSVVDGAYEVGGVAGSNNGDIFACYSIDTVKSYGTSGGIAGKNNWGYIAYCYSRSPVISGSSVGGLVGFNYKSNIYQSYSTGYVQGSSWTDAKGGLVGNTLYANVIECFWDSTTSQQKTSFGGAARNTQSMKTVSTFLDSYWNFTSIWKIDPNENDGYPHLDDRTISVPDGTEPTDTDGDGYKNISSMDELTWLMRNISAWADDYELDNDINASETKDWDNFSGWNGIGKFYGSEYFTGSFNGNGHVIDSLYLLKGSNRNLGFFGHVSGDTNLIENLGLTNSFIIGNIYTGTLAGVLVNSKVKNCYAETRIFGISHIGGLIGNIDTGRVEQSYSKGTQTSPYDYVGGFVGDIEYGSVVNSYSEVDVTNSNEDAGGFAGGNYFGIIKNCYATGYVEGYLDSDDEWQGNEIGGFVGSNGGTIHNSYATGFAKGYKKIGGFAGINFGNIINSYSTGNAYGDHNFGGFAGANNYNGALIFNSFWDTQSSGNNTSDGGTAKNTSEMQDSTTFINAGWNYDFIWENNSGYPEIAVDTSFRLTDTDGNNALNIEDFNDLRWLSESGFDFDRNWELDTNINASESYNINDTLGFIPIGYENQPYRMNFNGNGFEIDSLFINFVDPKNYDIGLFSSVGKNTGEVENLGLTNVNIKGVQPTGALVGYLDTANVKNCYSSGIIRAESYTGGLVGYNKGGTISNSYTSDSVITTNSFTGGLLGYSEYGTVERSYSTAHVMSDGSYAGGLVGENKAGQIINSYARGNVSGYSYVGGLLGRLEDSPGKVEFSYSTGEVSAQQYYYGGLIADKNGGDVNNSLWDEETSTLTFSDGGQRKTTSEMKTKSTFTDDNWNFNTIWAINPSENDGYPYLREPSEGGSLFVTMAFYGIYENSSHLPVPVKVELRSGSMLMSSTIDHELSGVVDNAGTVEIPTDNLSSGDYWLIVRNSSYMPVAAPNKISIDNSSNTTYDFTTSSSQSVLGTSAMDEKDNIWQIRPGDFNLDNSVGAFDANEFIPHFGKSVRSEIPEIADTNLSEGSYSVEKRVEVKVLYAGIYSNNDHKNIAVMVELLSGSDIMSADVVSRKTDIISDAGMVSVDFGDVSDGDYWLIVRTPGYMPVAAPQKITLSSSGVNYDFTTSSSQSILGTSAMNEENGEWLVRPGDINLDNSVGAFDANEFIPHFGKAVRSEIPEE